MVPLLMLPALPQTAEVFAISAEQLRSQYERVAVASGSFAMLDTERPNILDPSLFAYLQYEAERRGITIREAYREEMEGQDRARREAFTPQELQRLVETSQPDPRLLDGDEECPF